MDEHLALSKPDNISLEQAAGVGVGVEVGGPNRNESIFDLTKTDRLPRPDLWCRPPLP